MVGEYIRVSSCSHRSRKGNCYHPNRPSFRHKNVKECPYHHSSPLDICEKLFGENARKKEEHPRSTKAKSIFSQFIENNAEKGEQLSSTVDKFTGEVITPIMKIIEGLEIRAK